MAGNVQLRYKEALNAIEATSPGTKAEFFLGYLERGVPVFMSSDDVRLSPCDRCGQPTPGRFCAFCRAPAQVLGERPMPLEEPEVVGELSDEVRPAEMDGRA